MKKQPAPLDLRGPISLSTLRANIYKIFDKVIESGEPIEIHRAGTTLKIIPEQRQPRKSAKNKLDRIKRINLLNCKPEELLNLNWEYEWLKNVEK